MISSQPASGERSTGPATQLHCGQIPILYSFRRCPYAIRARWALYLCGRTVELREILLRDKPPCLAAYSKKATVPVLVLPDGRVLDESIDIVDWALSVADPEGLETPLCSEGRHLARLLIEQNDQQFKPLLDRYKYADRYPQQSQQDYRQQAEVFLALLEARLQRGQFLLGAKRSLADVAILSFIRQFAAVDSTWFDRSPYPALRSWLEQGLASDSFVAVMDKVPRWQPGQSVCVFPAVTRQSGRWATN